MKSFPRIVMRYDELRKNNALVLFLFGDLFITSIDGLISKIKIKNAINGPSKK